jgi:hypothetical protein
MPNSEVAAGGVFSAYNGPAGDEEGMIINSSGLYLIQGHIGWINPSGSPVLTDGVQSLIGLALAAGSVGSPLSDANPPVHVISEHQNREDGGRHNRIHYVIACGGSSSLALPVYVRFACWRGPDAGTKRATGNFGIVRLGSFSGAPVFI